MTRSDTVGAAAGVFLFHDDSDTTACGGLWTLTARGAANDLTMTESFPQGQLGCLGIGSARLHAVAAQLELVRATDGGAPD